MRTWLTRRRFIVDWKLQGSLVLHGLFYGGFVLVALAIGIFLPLIWNIGRYADQQQEELSIVMLYMHERFLGIVAACAVVVVFSAVRSSHRIAGPLVRYKRNLRLLATGRLPEALRTRPGDYLGEEVACLNDAVEGVARRIDDIRAAHAALRTQLANTTAAGSLDPETLASLQAADQALARSIDEFRRYETGDARGVLSNAADLPTLAIEPAR
ncbi:MAG: hypothetical protein K8J09_06800 [Planctomycetes bacterium]|nr:hypothetical protein [Planctomycetota bacterium]MCC7396008.1 hypothetical protein [Planctomycetota bacterium]